MSARQVPLEDLFSPYSGQLLSLKNALVSLHADLGRLSADLDALIRRQQRLLGEAKAAAAEEFHRHDADEDEWGEQ